MLVCSLHQPAALHTNHPAIPTLPNTVSQTRQNIEAYQNSKKCTAGTTKNYQSRKNKTTQPIKIYLFRQHSSTKAYLFILKFTRNRQHGNHQRKTERTENPTNRRFPTDEIHRFTKNYRKIESYRKQRILKFWLAQRFSISTSIFFVFFQFFFFIFSRNFSFQKPDQFRFFTQILLLSVAVQRGDCL